MQPTLDAILKSYTDLNFYLLPVYPKAKNPIGKDHNKTATNDLKKLIKMSEENPGCNWGMLPKKGGYVVIDVDAHKGGLEIWDQVAGHLKINTMTARTPRGGLHLVFKAGEGLTYSNPLKDSGVDCQFSNIIVVHPSTNADGVQYMWINESPIIEMPEELTKIFARTKGADLLPPPKLIGAESFFQKLAVQLKTKVLDYNTWLSIGMALHSAMPTAEGLSIWKDISRGPSHKEGDDDVCESKWIGFSAKPDGLSYRSLRFIAQDLGCTIPSLSLEEDKLMFATDKQKIQLEADNHSGWFEDDNGKICCRHEDFIVNYLNQSGFFIQKEENAGAIGQLVVQPNGYKEVFYLKLNELSNAIDNRFYKTYKRNREGGGYTVVYKKISSLWMQSKSRQEYRKVIFRPTPEQGCLNLWSPLPLSPMKAPKGAIEPVLDLVMNGLADGNYEKGAWLIQWLAHIVQRPFERCSLVPVVIGDQGTGKGMIFDRIMGAILGHFHYKINTARTLKERFNAEQMNRLMTLIDEASWRGDREEDGILKGLTGSLFMTVERKFGGRISIENYSRYVILSNNKEAVSIERSNRRYVVFEANPEFIKRHDQFAEIAESLSAGLLGPYFMDFLLSVSLEGFNPNKMVEFDDGQGQQAKVTSNGIEALFWEDYFSEPNEKLWFENKLIKARAYDAFLSFAKKINTYEKNLTPNKFWAKTSDFFQVKTDEMERFSFDGVRHRVVQVDPFLALKGFNSSLKLKIGRTFENEDVSFSVPELQKFQAVLKEWT
jgi:hypothetical protein